MYLAEIADKDIRGTLSVGTRFMFNLGALLVTAVGPFMSYQTLNSSLVILPVCYFVACWWIPESPYYYLKEGRTHDAGKTLTKLRSYKDKKVWELLPYMKRCRYFDKWSTCMFQKIKLTTLSR